MLSELSKYRSSVLCDARDGRTPPIGKLPVVDLEDAAQRAAQPEWHDYIRNPFGCPEHPALRRGSSPKSCDCTVPSKVECYDAPKFAKNNAAKRFDCTPSWIEEHKVIC